MKIPNIKNHVSDVTTFDYVEDGFAWKVRVKIEPDESPYDVEPKVGVVVSVGLVVETSDTKHFVLLGQSSLWGIEGLDAEYARAVVVDELSEALGQAGDALYFLACKNNERTSVAFNAKLKKGKK